MPLILYLRPRRGAEGAISCPTELFAIAADALAVLQMRQDPRYGAWTLHGTPTQALGLFLLLHPDCRPADVPLEPGRIGWALLAPNDLQDLIDEPGEGA